MFEGDNMNKNTKKILSFALASTILTSVNAPSHATTIESKKSDTTIEETYNEDLEYKVQDGDYIGRISELFFGTSKYYEIIAKYNHIEEPWTIYTGEIIKIPGYLRPYLVPFYPREYAPDEVYTVKENDYLFDIVEKFYGVRDLNYVNKLATYNELLDPNIIHVNQKLLIPEEAKLYHVESYDYTLQYQMLEFRINHPEEEYPEWILDAIEELKEEYECRHEKRYELIKKYY